MKCKIHHTDFSSGVGVCASCLRERLFALISAQEQAQIARAAVEDRRKLLDPPQLVFPRSVSPYVTRRKSDDGAVPWPHHQRFYSTPQVGPTFSSATTTTDFAVSRSFHKKRGKFSLFSYLFRTRSEKLNSDPSNCCEEESSPSSSWFGVFAVRRKKQRSRSFYKDESRSSACDRKPSQILDRGMSPVKRESTEEGGDDRSPCGSSPGVSPPQQKRTPAVNRRGKAAAQGKNMSGFAFCLSPLVRPSPNRHWHHKTGSTPDISFTGEIRAPVKPHLAAAASFCKNRSRKLADFGRVNPNR